MVDKYPWKAPAQTVTVPSVPGVRATESQVESGAKGYEPEPEINPPVKSRTTWGGVLQVLSGAGAAMVGAFQWISTPLGFAAFCILLALLVVGLWMVLSGRLRVAEEVKKLKEMLG